MFLIMAISAIAGLAVCVIAGVAFAVLMAQLVDVGMRWVLTRNDPAPFTPLLDLVNWPAGDSLDAHYWQARALVDQGIGSEPTGLLAVAAADELGPRRAKHRAVTG